EHRLFSFIRLNWRGRVLRTLETVVNCIANTRTEKGLTVKAELDTRSYPTGIHIDDETMARLDLIPGSFHGEWNDTIRPQSHDAAPVCSKT
ncbi:MAG: ISAzo13 family transposase, partial [Firmicutes bacterium]|nr:ISAzo13 family transposase [Bacillota bacterium]